MPHEILQNAVLELSSFVSQIEASSVYITRPMYFENQEYFHNIVVKGMYNGSADSLLAKTQHIEASFGRNRNIEIKNGPRSLDIDLLLFSNIKVDTEELVIPHPRMTERAFVLIPMLEILQKSADKEVRDYYASCLDRLDDQDVIKKSPL